MFKYDDYPEIKKAHKICENFSKKMYAAEFKAEAKGTAKANEEWGQSIKNGLEFKTYVYSKIVFNIFAPIRPELTMVTDGKKYAWDSVFGQSFSLLNDSQKKRVAMMVEEERPYRLPDEYYDDKDWFEEQKKKDEESFLKKNKNKIK